VVRDIDVRELVAAARAREVRALARLISLVEDGAPQLREIAKLLAADTTDAYVIGLTGSPGVGKSTTTSELVKAYRAEGMRVAVLAVDPSSPFTGGALLGDRIRMQEHATDPDVFIRSMATRGHLGGLSAATPMALRVLGAGGFDIVLVETVGVGQSEVEVAGTADTTLVLLAPGMGDGIQAAKAGILEIGDVLVVNKADRDGADSTARELRQMLTLVERGSDEWRPPVEKLVASTGDGLDVLVRRIAEHRTWGETTGAVNVRRTRRAAAEVEAVAVAELRSRLGHHRTELLDELAARVATGALDVYTAADELVAALVT
jgi:LAO/AO transport system kinase